MNSTKIYFGKEDEIERDEWGEPEHIDTWEVYYFKYNEDNIILISWSQAGAGTDVFRVPFIPAKFEVKTIDVRQINNEKLRSVMGAIFK